RDADGRQREVKEVVAGLAASGFAVVADFLPRPVIAALRAEAVRRAAADELTPAGIGRGGARIERADIRGDLIHWLDDVAAVPAERALRIALETLRSDINR